MQTCTNILSLSCIHNESFFNRPGCVHLLPLSWPYAAVCVSTETNDVSLCKVAAAGYLSCAGLKQWKLEYLLFLCHMEQKWITRPARLHTTTLKLGRAHALIATLLGDYNSNSFLIYLPYLDRSSFIGDTGSYDEYTHARPAPRKVLLFHAVSRLQWMNFIIQFFMYSTINLFLITKNPYFIFFFVPFGIKIILYHYPSNEQHGSKRVRIHFLCWFMHGWVFLCYILEKNDSLNILF